jgi:hypothetical protein
MIARMTVRILLGICGLLALLVLWGALSARDASKLRPPATVRTFPEFLREMPPPVKVRTFLFEGTNYFEVWGQMGGFIMLPSGSSSYIFDPGGRLVDWVPDRGDAGNYHRKWGYLKDARFISVEEMLHMLGCTNSPAP